MNNIKLIGAFGAGVIIGSGIVYILMKDKFQKRLDEECAEVREYYISKLREYQDQLKEINASAVSDTSASNMIYHEVLNAFKSYSTSVDVEDSVPDLSVEDSVKFETSTPDLHVISEDEFNNMSNGYDKDYLVYYSKNDILTDSSDDPLDEDAISSMIGDLHLQPHLNGDRLYIRNDSLETEYCINYITTREFIKEDEIY